MSVSVTIHFHPDDTDEAADLLRRLSQTEDAGAPGSADDDNDGEGDKQTLSADVLAAVSNVRPSRQAEVRRLATRIQSYGIRLEPTTVEWAGRLWMHAPGATRRGAMGYIDPSRVVLVVPPDHADGREFVDRNERSFPGGSVSIKVARGGPVAEAHLWELLPIAIRQAQ